MTTHEKYQNAVKELNIIQASIKLRKARCEHLYRGASQTNNPEQQEAYIADLHKLRPKLLEVVRRYEELKQEIESMPKTWIV